MIQEKIDLEAIAAQYSPAVEIIRQEREKLGLATPEDIKIRIVFSNSIAGLAENGIIYISPLSNAQNLNAGKRKQICDIGIFFDGLKSMAMGPSVSAKYDLIFEILYGEREFSVFRARYRDEVHFKESQHEFEKDRKKILHYFVDNAAQFSSPPSEDTINTMAHEIDHLDYESRFKQEEEQIQSLEKKMAIGDYSEISLLKEIAEMRFKRTSEIEARGLFFGSFRRTGYNPDKIDCVKDDTLEFLGPYMRRGFILLYLRYLIEKEGKKAGIPYRDLTESCFFINALFGTTAVPEEKRDHALQNYHINNPEMIGRIVLEATEKMKEYWERCKITVDKVYEEYRQRLQK